MTKVKIPTPLLKFTGDKSLVEVKAGNVKDLIDALEKECPGVKDRLINNGEVNRFINIYVDGEDIRFQSGLETQVGAESEVSIVPAISGG